MNSKNMRKNVQADEVTSSSDEEHTESQEVSKTFSPKRSQTLKSTSDRGTLDTEAMLDCLLDVLAEKIAVKLRTSENLAPVRPERPPDFPADLSGKLLSLQDAAAYLGLAPNTLYKPTWRKRLPVVKVGGKVMFRRRDLDDYISGNRTEGEGRATTLARALRRGE